MDFKKQKPIYLQIADTLCERIMAGEWQVDERIPSVRDVAAELGVNPNTVMRTYDHLQNTVVAWATLWRPRRENASARCTDRNSSTKSCPTSCSV